MRGTWLIGAGVSAVMLFGGFKVGTLPSTRAVPVHAQSTTLEAATEPCVFVTGGEISGNVIHAGSPAPDGTYVDIIFGGGPSEGAVTAGGLYSLPLLARACADGVRWVPFAIWAGGESQGVAPTSWNPHLVLNAPNPITSPEAASFPNGAPPLCALELGTVSGAVQIDGAPAPDGTVVVATTPTTLMQSVLTSGGRYLITSVGSVCTDGSESFIAMTLSAGGASVTITPTQDTTSQDLAGSSAATTSQAPATDGQ